MCVLNIGSLNIDYVYEMPHFVQPGETLSSLRLQINCGGKGLNQSIAAAKAGLEVYHAGCIGEEGLFLVEKLAQSGVHTDYIRQVEERPATPSSRWTPPARMTSFCTAAPITL